VRQNHTCEETVWTWKSWQNCDKLLYWSLSALQCFSQAGWESGKTWDTIYKSSPFESQWVPYFRDFPAIHQ